MPKYKNKKRLESYIAKHGPVDSLTEYFILQGESDDTIKAGLEPYVEDWEEAVKWIERDTSEYDWDLWQRISLYEILRHATAENIEPYRDRIEKADEKFRSITHEVAKPITTLFDDKEIINRNTHWWLFRIPNHGEVWMDCRTFIPVDET